MDEQMKKVSKSQDKEEDQSNNKTSRWEQRWVAIKNILEANHPIILRKWILVDQGSKPDNEEKDYTEYSVSDSVEEEITEKGKQRIKRANCNKELVMLFAESRFVLSVRKSLVMLLNLRDISLCIQ